MGARENFTPAADKISSLSQGRVGGKWGALVFVKINRFPHNHARDSREKEKRTQTRAHTSRPCTHVSFSPGSRVKRGRGRAFFLAPRRDRVARRGLVAIFQRARLRHEGKPRKAARGEKSIREKRSKNETRGRVEQTRGGLPMGFCALHNALHTDPIRRAIHRSVFRSYT